MSDGFCSELSAAGGESLAATAPRTDVWLLLEARGLWEAEAIESLGVPAAAREAVAQFLEAVPFSRAVLVRRPARRDATGANVFLVDARPGRETALRLELGDLAELAGLDLAGAVAGVGAPAAALPGAAPVDHPLLLVCTHGKRDACCARVGLKLAAALEAELPAEWLWQTSHVGGHRFAGNVVWLPPGVYLGRVAPEDAAEVAAAVRARRIPLAHARGRSTFPPPAQAADLELRDRLGLDGLDDVSLAGAPEPLGGGGFRVRLAVRGGVEHALEVRPEPAPPIVVSCGLEPEPQTRLVVA